MTGTVVTWPQRVSPAGWTNEELAELYRVEHSLLQAGLVVETESGVSDEGDPWFVFCHADGHVVVHAARIGGRYILHCATLPNPLTGRSFAEIAKTFVGMIAKGQDARLSGRVVAHPSALLSLIVAAAVLSVDAVLHDTARASGLPRDHFVPQTPPLAPDPSIAKEFADIYFSAVWRNSGGSGRREPVWQAVEDAAIGLFVLAAPGFPFDGSLKEKELSVTMLTQGDEHIREIAKTFRDHLGHGISADSVGGIGSALDRADAIADGNVETTAVFAPFDSKAPSVDAFKLTALADFVVPETAAVYATPTGMTASSGPVGALSLSQVKTEPSSFLSLNSADGTQLNVTLNSGGKAIDLDSFAPGSVTLIITGDGALTATHATAIQSIEVASGTKAELTLSYDGSPPTGIEQTVMLNGATEVSIKPESTTSAAPSLSLAVDSQGAQPNTLSLVDATNGPSPNLDVNVTGSQDLTLNESAATAISSTLDASTLSGKLTVGIDLSEAGASTTILSLGGGSFVVTPDDTVAFAHLSGHPQVELGVDLESVLFSYSNDATGGGPITLGIELGSLGPTSSPLEIGWIAPAGVNDLTITSSNGPNSIGVIDDSALSTLTLSGSSSLKIGSIGGITANDGQNVLIDAQTFNGNLSLDASGVADTFAGGRQVAIVTGSGESSITDTNVTENLELTIGSGAAFINIAGGSEQVAINGLSATDEINVGSGSVADRFTNGLATLLPHQAAIDASANLTAASAMAASFGEPTAPHEALLFSYHGNTYVFVDASGSHVFDPSADAIIKVIGATASTSLSGVFHSA